MTEDTTLGGYQQVHGRPPAFGANDGQAYSVAAFTDDTAESGRYGAALMFIRWGDGDKPVGHLETDFLAFGATAEEALAPVLALSLAEVKAHLDRCVAQQANA